MFKKERKENHLGLGRSSQVEFLPKMLEALGSIHDNFLRGYVQNTQFTEQRKEVDIEAQPPRPERAKADSRKKEQGSHSPRLLPVGTVALGHCWPISSCSTLTLVGEILVFVSLCQALLGPGLPGAAYQRGLQTPRRELLTAHSPGFQVLTLHLQHHSLRGGRCAGRVTCSNTGLLSWNCPSDMPFSSQ